MGEGNGHKAIVSAGIADHFNGCAVGIGKCDIRHLFFFAFYDTKPTIGNYIYYLFFFSKSWFFARLL